MKILEVGPSHGRVHEVGGRRHQGAPLVADPLAAVQEHRDRPGADRRRLSEEQHAGSGNHPVDGDEEEQDERRVIAEEVATHKRDERSLELREQPHTLVVKRRVVTRRAECMVVVERTGRVVPDVRDDHRRQDDLARGSASRPGSESLPDGQRLGRRLKRVGFDVTVGLGPVVDESALRGTLVGGGHATILASELSRWA